VSHEIAAARIAKALEALARGLDELQAAGAQVPAVERNTVRLRGTLRALQIQFEDLVRVQSGGGL
jgi:hypothetical protein